jgi:hypothetical protein
VITHTQESNLYVQYPYKKDVIEVTLFSKLPNIKKRVFNINCLGFNSPPYTQYVHIHYTSLTYKEIMLIEADQQLIAQSKKLMAGAHYGI